MARAWQVLPGTMVEGEAKSFDVYRNRRIYRYDEETLDDAIETTRRRSSEGDTLEADGKKYVKRGRKWERA